MTCERCMRAEEARYRAYSDIIDMKVCAPCAVEGSRLGLGIEAFDPMSSSLSRPGWQRRDLIPLTG
jgi:hypothetical protein